MSIATVPVAGSPPLIPEVLPEAPILSRKRRMNFYDLANLLDSDGNLQNEMLVFAFAATMLSTIPVLLGNEFDVNVGLRRRRDLPEDPMGQVYASYPSADDENSGFYTDYSYQKIMTNPTKKVEDAWHIHQDAVDSKDSLKKQYVQAGFKSDQEDLGYLLRELLEWSQEKTKNKSILPMLINLALDRYHGYSNPADKLVRTAYKKWKSFRW